MEILIAVIQSPVVFILAMACFIVGPVFLTGDQGAGRRAEALWTVFSGAGLLFLRVLFPETSSGSPTPKATQDLAAFFAFAGPWVLGGISAGLIIASVMNVGHWVYRRRNPLGPAPRFRTGMIEPVVPDELAVSLSGEDLAAWIAKNTRWFIETKVGFLGSWKRDTDNRISQADAVDAIGRSLALWRQREGEALAESRAKSAKPAQPREFLSKKVFK